MPERLSCASWLVYATRATDDQARRVIATILSIKTDRRQSSTGIPFVRAVVERAAELLVDDARRYFDSYPMLVPVPGSGLTRPNTVWPAHRICEELVSVGLGDDVLPTLTRAIAVPKSAGRAIRPTLEMHFESLSVQTRLTPPSRLLLIDDVVTSGTTMMACARKLALAFPGVPVSGFALARVQSKGNPSRVFEPVVEYIAPEGSRCTRRPQS